MIPSHETLAAAILISAISFCTDARAQNASEKTAGQKSTGKHYVLPANKDTVQWGWYDASEKPKLVVNSGDTVSIETWSHGMDEVQPGVPIDEIIKLRLANDGGGPHSITGPIMCTVPTRRHPGNPHHQNRHEGLRLQLQSARQTISRRRFAGLRVS